MEKIMSRLEVVRAVDVGYGNTKYVLEHQHGNEVVCALFPSLAPQASQSPDLGVGVLKRRNSVTVDVNGIRYEVGKDAHLAQDSTHGRILDSSYPASDPYLALIRGAMFYMGVTEIDLLVVGLPVTNFVAYKDTMSERLVGTHLIPNVKNIVMEDDSVPKMVEVTVKKVQVLPQPLGAFFDYSIRSNLYSEMKNQMNLLIDPGYYTLDWLLAHGTKPIEARSGGHEGGMSAILTSIADSVGKKIGARITDLSSIDVAVRTGKSPRFFGKEEDISSHIAEGKAKARQFISVLANKVGSGIDVDNIILAGGGAEFFKEAIQDKFPKHNLIVTREPVFANVRGFQIAGEEWVKAAAVRERSAARV
jgi:plasmid segregation protein ParM